MISLALFFMSLFGLCYGTREWTGLEQGVWLARDVITHVVSVAGPMSLIEIDANSYAQNTVTQAARVATPSTPLTARVPSHYSPTS
jgi:hypothetical protein